jgi:hypothetical protein
VAESLHLCEHLEGARGAEPFDLEVDGPAQVVQISLDLLAAEEVLRVVAPAEEEFERGTFDLMRV